MKSTIIDDNTLKQVKYEKGKLYQHKTSANNIIILCTNPKIGEHTFSGVIIYRLNRPENIGEYVDAAYKANYNIEFSGKIELEQ